MIETVSAFFTFFVLTGLGVTVAYQIGSLKTRVRYLELHIDILYDQITHERHTRYAKELKAKAPAERLP